MISDHIKMQDNDLIPAIIVDDKTGDVLTLCYMNREAIEKTIETKFVHLYRRSKKTLQKKGGTSGHTQAVKSIYIDCAGNSLLIRVDQNVAACHAGYFSCYFTKFNPSTGAVEITAKKVFDPDKVY